MWDKPKQTRSRHKKKIEASYPFLNEGSDVDQATSSPSSNDLKRTKRNEDNEEMRSDIDMLSKLPDDVVVYMLSFMDMKTAGRTSILSKRWRYIWTFITDLDFKDPKYFNQSFLALLTCDPYCEWINNVTTAHRAPILNSIRIHIPLHRTHNELGKVNMMEYKLWVNVDEWIKFGLRKKVTKLELNFATANATAHMQRFGLLSPNLSHFKTNWTSPYLKSLHLEALCIDGSLVEKVLSSCLNLEQFIMKSCAFKCCNHAVAGKSSMYIYFTLRRHMELNHKISVSSLKLEHLEFDGCNIESIQISAPKLTSLVLIPLSTALTLPKVEYTSVPSLVDATFVTAYCFRIFRTPDFSSYTLEKLSIHWHEFYNGQRGLPNIYTGKVIALISLIEACPLLQTFKLELHSNWWEPESPLHVENAKRHQHLKVIEIIGYDRSESVDRLVHCLTNPLHTPKLNKIILDPCCPRFVQELRHTQLMYVTGLCREKAKLLANQISRGVEVVIL